MDPKQIQEVKLVQKITCRMGWWEWQGGRETNVYALLVIHLLIPPCPFQDVLAIWIQIFFVLPTF